MAPIAPTAPNTPNSVEPLEHLNPSATEKALMHENTTVHPMPTARMVRADICEDDKNYFIWNRPIPSMVTDAAQVWSQTWEKYLHQQKKPIDDILGRFDQILALNRLYPVVLDAQKTMMRADTYSVPEAYLDEMLQNWPRETAAQQDAYRWIKQDIALQLHVFAKTLGVMRLRVSFGPVHTDLCRKFHVDFISMRMISTYTGAGTQWLNDDNINRHALGKSHGSIEDDNQAICKDPQKIQQAQSGDVLWLKGAKWRGAYARGVVHRSPPAIAGQGRIVLVATALD